MEQGCLLELNLQSMGISISKYWDVNTFYSLPKLKLPYDEAKSNLSTILSSAFNFRMVADVPVGVFLSGGYDSTAVTAILQKERTQRLKTFTIGFEKGNNESPFAKETANFLGTDHTDFICTTLEAQSIIPELPLFYDEPFADSSAIPTILVSQIARKSVTVALSADGGDEIFAGYNTYFQLDKYQKQLNHIPNVFKSPLRPFLHFLSTGLPNSTLELKHKIKGIADSISKDKYYQTTQLLKMSCQLPQHFNNSIFTKHPISKPSIYDKDYRKFSNELEIAMAIDYKMYLQNDILTKVDRATMSVSLEGREPLLDHRITEFAAQLPINYKYDGTTGKRILKDIVHDHVPKKMMDRPKTGFSLPIYTWLQSDLSFLIEDYLNETALSISGIFNVPFLLKQVKLFKEDKLHYKPFIWKLLMFQMWYFKWMK